jgi:4-amino-4-deoxy-L-arabinose transferase-like glycosyltransferase
LIRAQKYISIVGWLLFGGLAYCCIFLHLDRIPIKVWDESLFAMRAYYLATQGALLDNFSYFPSFTDYPNLKPPLGTFIQAASFRLLGYNELALRLPTAIFALLTSGLLIYFSRRTFDSYLLGILASLILFTSSGYIAPHVARTGDHDVLIAFWVLASVFVFYGYTQTFSRKYFWLLVVLLLAGFLTKSIVAFFVLPGFVLYLLCQNKLVAALKQPMLYLGIASLAVALLAYYLAMDQANPGFISKVSETVFGRYTGERNEQGHDFWFYFRQMGSSEFLPWVVLLPLNLYVYFATTNKNFKSLSLLLWSSLLSFLLVISFSATQLVWYEAPVYPLAAFMAGMTLYLLLSHTRIRMIATIVSLLAFIWAFYNTVHFNMHYQPSQPEEQFAYLMKKLEREQSSIKAYTIYSPPFNGQVGFYTPLYNEQKGYDIEVMTYWQDEQIRDHGYLMIYTDEQKTRAEQSYDLNLVAAYKNVRLYRCITNIGE